MSEAKPVKSKDFYGLLIDEKRATVFSILFSTCFAVEPLLEKQLKEFDVETCFTDLLKEISDKEHALNWCENPECKHKLKE